MKSFQMKTDPSQINNPGFTIVELMVTLVIIIAIGGIASSIFLTQHRSVMDNQSVFDVRGPAYAATELLKRDFSQAGYGVLDLSDISNPKNLAFFIQNGSGTNPDRLYLFDGSYIDYDELENDMFAELGYAFFSGNGTSITLNRLNLDAGMNDNCYGNGSNCDEFQFNIRQYIITNTTDPTKKTASIRNIAGTTLTLSSGVSGGTNKSLVSPAIFYCVHSGYDTFCSGGDDTNVLKRSSRSSGGRQPVVSGIVDMQVAYRDKAGTWYCDGSGTCPMNPFIPGNITLVRITLISQRENTTQNGNLTAQAEDGRTWNSTDYSYTPHTVLIRPRNNIQFN